MLLFCIDGGELDSAQMEIIAHAFPNARIFVRAYDRRQMMALHGAPIAGTVREVYESAICLARQAMAALGIAEDEIFSTEARYRDVDSRRLAAQARAGDLHAGQELMIRVPTQPQPGEILIPAESG